MAADAPFDMRRELVPAFGDAVGSLLGVTDSTDLLRRADRVRAFLLVRRQTAESFSSTDFSPS